MRRAAWSGSVRSLQTRRAPELEPPPQLLHKASQNGMHQSTRKVYCSKGVDPIPTCLDSSHEFNPCRLRWLSQSCWRSPSHSPTRLRPGTLWRIQRPVRGGPRMGQAEEHLGATFPTLCLDLGARHALQSRSDSEPMRRPPHGR